VLAKHKDLAGFRWSQPHRGLEQYRLAAARGPQDDARFSLIRFKRNVLQRHLSVERDGDAFESQHRGAGFRGHQFPTWLTKTLVISTSSTKINTVANTMACVVDLPTPCVPPVVRR